jgi:hypothetical protein
MARLRERAHLKCLGDAIPDVDRETNDAFESRLCLVDVI